MKKLLFILILLSIAGSVFSQKRKKEKKPVKRESRANKQDSQAQVTISPDTTQPRTVVVTAAFSPSLKTSSKIDFSAAAPSPDSVLPTLSYNVPAQNLFFSYQSVPLKPLAEKIDTAIHWQNKNFIKGGYGNYTTPYVQTGLSFVHRLKRHKAIRRF
jgi:hypothetical protein